MRPDIDALFLNLPSFAVRQITLVATVWQLMTGFVGLLIVWVVKELPRKTAHGERTQAGKHILNTGTLTECFKA